MTKAQAVHGSLKNYLLTPLLALVLTGLSGCFPVLKSDGGGQTTFEEPRAVEPSDVALLDGYEIEAVATGLTFPTGVAFDEVGEVYVLEAGYSYGEVVTEPRLLHLGADGNLEIIATGDNPPWNGLTFHDGAFYIGGGTLKGGQILQISKEGEVTPLLENLPSFGDHHTNSPVVGPDNTLYFGQGTATNSGVVGLDNADFGWLFRYPEFHDIPCQDITLAGENYTTPNPLTQNPDDVVTTGPYQSFGTPATPGQVVRGQVPCTGAIMKIALKDGAPEVVASGLRNPFSLAWSPDGELYVLENSYDVRGSRPVFGSGDVLWRIEEGVWYGWPDFHGGRPLTEADQYQAPGEPAPDFVLAEHPDTPPDPVALLGVHSSSNGMDFARNPEFGFVGQAFIAQFGDMAPDVGKVLGPVGFKVVRLDVESGVVQDFAVNRKPHGPASKVGGGGLERPVSVRFSPDGSALYVVDFGVMTIGEQGPEPRPGTGVLWRITRSDQ